MEIARDVLREVVLICAVVGAVLAALVLTFGSVYPFFVVISGSMVPTLEIDDLLVVSSRVDFGDVKTGDIILFNRPSDYVALHDMDADTGEQGLIMIDNPADHGRVIVHRVVEVLDDDPRTLRAQGDANPASIPGVDFPIVREEYLGVVVYVIPEVGSLTDVIRPPVSYVLIGVILGLVAAYELHTHPKWRWSLILLALHLRDSVYIYVKVIRYDPKSRKARTLFVRQALKNHFSVVFMSAGLMNWTLKSAKTYEDVPDKYRRMYRNMLLTAGRAGKMLDSMGNLLDAELVKDIRRLLSKIESVDIKSGVGSGYPNYDDIKNHALRCTERLDVMGEDAVLK